MKLNPPTRASAIIIGGVCLCILLRSTVSAEAPPSRQAPPGGIRDGSPLHDALEAARYSSLPPTVFAPGGRLHGVERVAREALCLDDDAADESVSCGVMALHCGCGRSDGAGDGDGIDETDDDVLRTADGDVDDGEFVVMAVIGAISPFLHREKVFDDAELRSRQLFDDKFIVDAEEDEQAMRGTYLPLEIDESPSAGSATIGVVPLAILSPNLIAGAGGKAIDSTVLLRRATEAALSMYANDNGGIDCFISQSMEGTIADVDSNDGEDARSPSRRYPVVGGAAGVDVTSLVRWVADMAQGSTQSLGGRYGRMLSSSLLAAGARNPTSSLRDSLILWRVDPTGQFWRLNASAVGRGGVNAELELLRRVREWTIGRTEQVQQRQEHQFDDDSKHSDVSQDDVRAYLGSLSVEEAVTLAIDCLIDGRMASIKRTNTGDATRGLKQYEESLRKRIQTVVLRSNTEPRQSKPCLEFFSGQSSSAI